MISWTLGAMACALAGNRLGGMWQKIGFGCAACCITIAIGEAVLS